nr:uncharacterized protein LOC127305809 [Lolium perenne]
MYSCRSDRDRTGEAERALAFSAQYQPCNTATTTWAPVHMQAAGQVDPSDAQQLPPRRPRRRHSTSASRRSSTTVVATDVSNFRAKVQELTGFPPAAIFRPQPRRAHATAASHSLLAAAHGCGAGVGPAPIAEFFPTLTKTIRRDVTCTRTANKPKQQQSTYDQLAPTHAHGKTMYRHRPVSSLLFFVLILDVVLQA